MAANRVFAMHGSYITDVTGDDGRSMVRIELGWNWVDAVPQKIVVMTREEFRVLSMLVVDMVLNSDYFGSLFDGIEGGNYGN